MTILSTPTFSDNFTQRLIALPLPASADLFEVADHAPPSQASWLKRIAPASGMLSVGRLLHGLAALERLCDDDLPPHLIEQLIVGDAAGAGTGDTGEHPAAGRERGIDGVAARYGASAGGIREGALSHRTLSATDIKKPSGEEGKPRVKHARNDIEMVTQINAAETERSAEPGSPGPERRYRQTAGYWHGSWRTLPRRSQRPEYGNALRWC